MESSELNAFFNDCGLFPSQDEISEAVESVSKVWRVWETYYFICRYSVL